MIDFEIYQGGKTNLVERDLGLGPSVIMRLSETLPRQSSLFFDRYFTTIPLLICLLDKGMFGTGTLMTNRFKQGKLLKKDKTLKRGDSDQLVGVDGSKKRPIVVTKWMDNKSILLASTCCGKEPHNIVRRWHKSSNSYKDVSCPAVVSMYNQNMGGVDVLDQGMEYYRTYFKTKKWTVKLVLHFFDLSIVNSWAEYKRACVLTNVPKNKIKNLLQFRLELGEYLRCSVPQRRLDSIPEVVNPPQQNIPNRNRPMPLPSDAKRYDGFNHFASCDDLKAPLRCRNEDCLSRSKTRCEKCNVYLCLSKDRNCFFSFHNRQ